MANWQNIFNDDFATLSANWANVVTTGATATRPTVSGGIMTTLSYTILEHLNNIPYDPDSLYRVRVRAAQGASSGGSASLYLGICGIAANGTSRVNINGSNAISSQFYFAARAQTTDLGVYKLFTGYFMGSSGSPTGNEAPALTAPGPMHTNAKFVRPLLYLGYQNSTSAVSLVDYVEVDQVVAAARRVRLTSLDGTLMTWTQIQSWDTKDRARSSSVLRVIGRRDPIVLLDDLLYPSSTITFLTMAGEMDDFLLLMRQKAPINLASPCSSVSNGWYAVLGVREVRLTNKGSDGRRLFEVDVQEVTTP